MYEKYLSVDSLININCNVAYEMNAWNESSFGMSIKENLSILDKSVFGMSLPCKGKSQFLGCLQVLLPNVHYIIKRRV